jgi:hypothetical protein
VRSDQLDIVGLKQIVIEWVTIVGGVADQSFREFVEEALPEDFFDELAFVRRENCAWLVSNPRSCRRRLPTARRNPCRLQYAYSSW